MRALRNTSREPSGEKAATPSLPGSAALRLLRSLPSARMTQMSASSLPRPAKKPCVYVSHVPSGDHLMSKMRFGVPLTMPTPATENSSR